MSKEELEINSSKIKNNPAYDGKELIEDIRKKICFIDNKFE